MPELFEKWVDREKCPRCGELVNMESMPLHLDFCKIKTKDGKHGPWKGEESAKSNRETPVS